MGNALVYQNNTTGSKTSEAPLILDFVHTTFRKKCLSVLRGLRIFFLQCEEKALQRNVKCEITCVI